MFIDGNSNGNLLLYFDGVQVATITPGEIANGEKELADGGKFIYTSTVTTVNNQPVATITGNYTAVPGTHTFGAVQTNGPCAEDAGPACLTNNEGFVLAQGETTMLLQPGANPAATLYMRGVMQSAYVCDEGCAGQNLQVDGEGFYHLYVVVADENGTAIVQQKDASGNVIPFDNGAYSIVEQPDQPGNLLTILRKSSRESIADVPLTAPDGDRNFPPNGSYGVEILVKCENTGTTTLMARLGDEGGESIAPIQGFTAQPGVNYPTANAVLGSVGVDYNFGNQLKLNCVAGGALTVL